MSRRHGIGDVGLFQNHFISSLYDEFLMSGFHLKFEKKHRCWEIEVKVV